MSLLASAPGCFDNGHSKYISNPNAPVVTNAGKPSAQRNRGPILDLIRPYLIDKKDVFEVGSGTADQAAYFCKEMPNLAWQTSDRAFYHKDILETLKEAQLPKDRLKEPVEFDIENGKIEGTYDVVYASNIVHCVPLQTTEILFSKISTAIKANGLFILYGPFNVENKIDIAGKYALENKANIEGKYTSTGNRDFDQKIKILNPELGLKSISEVIKIAQDNGLVIQDVHLHESANNYVLIFKKTVNN